MRANELFLCATEDGGEDVLTRPRRRGAKLGSGGIPSSMARLAIASRKTAPADDRVDAPFPRPSDDNNATAGRVPPRAPLSNDRVPPFFPEEHILRSTEKPV